MKQKETSVELFDVDNWLDENYGVEGSLEREAFRKEAYNFCVGRLVHATRKEEKVTQEELARRLGMNKSYISKIENGVIEPSASLFFRIISALGKRIELIS